MRTLVSADFHASHSNIQSYEPARQQWPDPFAMNEGMIEIWNSVVEPDDFVFFLGDFAMGKIADSLPLALRLNGRKWLVTGNHDRTFSRKPSGIPRWRKAYHEAGFEVIVDELEFTFEGTPIRMSHFPYDGDHSEDGEDRYPERRARDDGTLLVCGHMHSTWQTMLSKKGTPMVNVGLDAVAKFTDRGHVPILLSEAVQMGLDLLR